MSDDEVEGPAIDDIPNNAGLVAYYKDKIGKSLCTTLLNIKEHNEKEMQEYLAKIDEISLSYKKQHDVEWELRRRESEIQALQEALSNAQLYIFDERERSIKLQHENDLLRIQELEDRRKIRDLLSLTQPVAQEVTYFKDCRPDQLTKHVMLNRTVKKPFTHPKSKPNTEIKGGEICIEEQGESESTVPETIPVSTPKPVTKTTSKPSPPNQTQSTSGRILRTVFMPNEKTDSLVLQIEALQTHIEESERLWAEKEKVLLEERKVRVDEENARAESDRATITKLQSELHRVTNLNMKTTREYFVLSHNFRINSRKQREDVEIAKMETATLQSAIENMKKKSKKDAKMLVDSAREQGEEFAKHFRQQTMLRENDLLALQDEMVVNKENYESKIQDLQKRYNKLNKSYKELTQRRAVDLEGFNTDVANLRRFAKNIESKLHRCVALHIPPQSYSDVDSFQHDQNELRLHLQTLKKRIKKVDKQVKRCSVSTCNREDV